jgi:cryptochrome
MKKAYKVGLYGDHPKVVDGTWRELFDDEGEGPTEGKSFEDAMGEGVGSEDKIREGPEGGDDGDGAVEEDERGAAEKGGETKGGLKRKKGQKTLDGHFKKLKT